MVSSSYSLAWTLRNLLVLTTSQRVLRETCVESADVLTYIFNQSLASGIVPADWRVANIFALHKMGAKELPENYRPISLTSIVYLNDLTSFSTIGLYRRGCQARSLARAIEDSQRKYKAYDLLKYQII